MISFLHLKKKCLISFKKKNIAEMAIFILKNIWKRIFLDFIYRFQSLIILLFIFRMHSTKVISGINNNELEIGISAEASWHNQFNSAYVYVGGINNFMN